MGKCVTQVDGELYLDHCYDGHPGQIWDPPDKQNYIQSAERGFCIKVGDHCYDGHCQIWLYQSMWFNKLFYFYY